MTTHRRPPRGIAAVNTIARHLLAAGMPMGFNGLLTVRGRRTSEARTTPLAIIERDGRRWVWSPWGEVHWVRNLRAAGRATVTVRKRRSEVVARELDAAERVRFFETVLAPIARGMRGGTTFIRLLDGVDLDDPVAAAEGKVAFELVAAP